MGGRSLNFVAWKSCIGQAAVMESSTIHGGAEECSSSESGWTTYIASPIHESDDDNSSSSSERQGYKSFQNEYGEDGESNDSMASDASSGPSHPGHPSRSPVRRSHGIGDYKNVGGKGKESNKENSKKAEKKKPTKEERGHKGKSLIGNACNRGKFRRNK